MKTKSAGNKLATYLQSHSIIRDSSEGVSGKNISFSVSMPIERYYLFKEISNRYNISMSQIVNVALHAFDSELLLSLDRESSFEIARAADDGITSDVGGEPVSHWYSKVHQKAEQEEFARFCELNPDIPEEHLDDAYQSYLAQSAREEIF